MRVEFVLSWLLLSGLPALPAQGTTWVVDVTGGPGSHFTQLPPAVAAAADGDTILVRTGSYTGFSTNKALTVLGQGSVTVSAQAVLLPPPVIEVRGLAAGKTFVASDLRVSYGGATGGDGIVLTDNRGRVHLQRMTVAYAAFPPSVGIAVWAQRCTEVTVDASDLAGLPGLRAADSAVVATASKITGLDACTSFICAASRSAEGAVADRAQLWLVGTTIHGGDGRSLGLPAPAQPALRTNQSNVWITGDATTKLVAGVLSGQQTAAVITTGGNVDLETNVTLTPSGGAAPVTGTATVVTRRVPWLTAQGVPPGSAMPIAIHSATGDIAYVVASVPEDPMPHVAGTVFVDPALLLPVLFGVQGASGTLSVTVNVPANAGLTGAPIVFQAANTSVLGVIEFTHPVVVALH